MTSLSTTGVSEPGFQVLQNVPLGFTRVFVDVTPADEAQAVYKGTILLGYSFGPSFEFDYIWDAKKLWGRGVMFLGVPTLAEGSNSLLTVSANWRVDNLSWTCFTDDL